jgi:hypothetical protein
MKLAFLTFSCDLCGEESPHCPTWEEATLAARRVGWRVGRAERGQPRGDDLCPSCRKKVGK